MGIFNSLNSESDQPGPGQRLPPTAGNGLMDWAQFIAAESHGIPPGKAIEVRGDPRWKAGRGHTACYNSCPRGTNVEFGECGPAVEEGMGSSAEEYRTTRQSSEGPWRSRRGARQGRKSRACSDARQEAKDNVSGSTQENFGGPARALGKVESSTAEQVSGRLCADPIGSQRNSVTCGPLRSR